MKKLFALSLILLVAGFLNAQDCKSFFPQEEGKVFEYHDLNKKGKLTATSTKTVLSKKKIPGGLEVRIREENKEVDIDTTTTIEYTIKCENGAMSVDMESMLMDNEQMSAYGDMETRVTADNMSIPGNAKAGDDLGGGRVVAEVYNGDTRLITISLDVKERKVEAVETVTTDAGSFECIKVNSKMEMKAIFKFTYSLSTWYAKDLGVVKSETYDKKGKLKERTVLAAIR